MEVIEWNGRFYSIQKNIHESREIYLQRCWFVINNFDKKHINELIDFSFIWSNIKYYKISYPDHIMSIIKSLEDPIDIHQSLV